MEGVYSRTIGIHDYMRKLVTDQQRFGGQSDPIFPHIEKVSF